MDWATHYEFMAADWPTLDREANNSSGSEYISLTDSEIEALRSGQVLCIWIAGSEYRLFVKSAGTEIAGIDEPGTFTEGAGQWPT